MGAEEKETPGTMSFTELFIEFAKMLAVLLIVWLAGLYNLSFAWILVAAIMTVVYVKQTKDRRKRRLIAREFADEPKSITDALKDLPAWVHFPDVERAEWINKILRQFWPYFGKVVEKALRESIAPVLRSKVPSSLSGISFETIRLGDLPPRIGGIKVHIDKVKRSEIILDVDLVYAGDSKITIAAKGLKVGVEDIQLRGTVRVILYPLLPELPLLGGVTMYFTNRPQLDFDLTNILNVLETPGLSTLLRNLIDDAIASYIVLPNKVAIPLSDQVKQGELQNRLPDGVLRIKVVEGRDLEAKDFKILGNGGTSDPYITIVVGAEKFSTSVKPCTLNPVWNETFEMFVEESNRRTIELAAFDRDRLPSKDERLGKKILTMTSLLETGYQDMWFPLEKAKTGKLHLQMTWLTLNDKPEIVKAATGTTPSKKSTLARAALIIHVDSASSLPRVRNSHSACNPVCKVIIGHSTQKTNKLSDTINPVWEQSLRFLVQDPEYQDAKFQIWDHKKDRLLGSLTVKIRNLLDKENMTMKQTFPLDDCSQDATLTAQLTLMGLTEPDKATSGEHDMSASNTPEGGERISPIGGENAIPTNEVAAEEEADDPFNDTQETSISSLNRSSSGKSDGEGKSKLGLFLRRARVFSSSSALNDDFKFSNPQGEISIAIVYREKTKKLVIGIFEARDLVSASENGDKHDINPYVRLYLLPDRSRTTRLTTDVVKQTSNPIFSETLWYMVESIEECKKKRLDVMVKSETPLIKKAKGVRYGLGRTIIDLAEEDLTSEEPKWMTLYRVDEN